MADNTSAWMDFAQRPYDEGGLGLKTHQAAGIIGNLQAESGSGLNAWGPTGDNGSAWGTAQWRGDRLAALKSMYPDTYQTPEAQMQFMRHELGNSESKAFKAIQAATTPEEAARAWDQHYERSDGSTREQRAANARKVFGSPVLPDAGAPPGTSYTQKGPGVPALSPDNTMGPGALSAQPEDPWDRRAEGISQIGASLAGIVNPAQAAAINSAITADHTDRNTRTQQALMAKVYGQRMAKDAQGSWTSHVMPNGQVMQTNTNGQTRMIDGNWSKDGTAGEQAPQMVPVWGNAKVLGDDPTKRTPEQEKAYFATMKPAEAAMVNGLLDNSLPPPTAAAMAKKDSPYPAAFAAAKLIDPTLDSTTYGARVAGQKDMATKGAESARALNQTISHQSEALIGAMKGLGNGDTPLWNRAKNVWSEEVSGSGAVPGFRTAAHAVVDELGKVFKQNNLSDTEIRKWEENLPPSMSPEQQRTQIAAFQTLMHGAMSALEDKRKTQIGARAAAKLPPLLSEDGAKGLQKLEEFAHPKADKPSADKRPSLDSIFN
jgi:hypothetical protein